MKNWMDLKVVRRGVWPVALAGLVGMMGASVAMAQETGGTIFGSAPAGQTVTVKGSTGAHRHVEVKDSGRYSIGRLPLGTYTVALENEGKQVDVRANVGVQVGRGSEVDFACPADHCEKQAAKN